jgi:phage terminase small subunit
MTKMNKNKTEKIDAKLRGDRPPAGMSERAHRLWLWVNKEYSLDQSSLAVLEIAMMNLDRYLQARDAVQKHGISTMNRQTGSIHANPEVGVEERAFKNFSKAWQLLGLNRKPPIDDEAEGAFQDDEA